MTARTEKEPKLPGHIEYALDCLQGVTSRWGMGCRYTPEGARTWLNRHLSLLNRKASIHGSNDVYRMAIDRIAHMLHEADPSFSVKSKPSAVANRVRLELQRKEDEP